MVNTLDKKGKKRVVIVGGGFGGLKLADKLDPELFEIYLIDKNNYHQFQPLYYQVAIAGLEPSSISYPFRKNFQKKKNIHFRMCEAQKVIPETNTLDTSIGSITYDYLIIASGSDTNYFGNNNLKDTTIALKSVAEALFARNRILQSFEDACSVKDPSRLEKLLTFVIVGGGATGVELAGALADMRRFVLPKDYPDIDFSLMRIYLIDGSPRLLFGMSEKASKIASETLQKRNVIICQNTFVTSYEDDIITTSADQTIKSSNVIWVGGVIANGMKGLSKEAFNEKNNRILVDEYCRVKGYMNIFAIGDTAYMETEKYPKGHPQVAQGAIQMGSFVAKSLKLMVLNKEVKGFEYIDKGSLATIGRNAAVADLHSFRFGGRVAWWLWLLVHISTILGIKNKLSVFIDWAWNYVTYDVSLRLLIRPVLKKISRE